MNERTTIGHNMPPSAIDDARAAFKALSDYLAATPVIADDATAREAKLYVDRAKLTLADLDAAKTRESKPLHDEWKACLEKFKPATEYLTRVADELKTRLAAYMRAEETRRLQEAAEAWRIAQEAERAAREAERLEAEAKENAAMGEIGSDVGAAIVDADAAFAEFERAKRAAAIADKDAHLRIGGGFSRVASLRTKETLVLEDAGKALKAIGLTDKIRDAILSGARDYRRLKGKLPAGVAATTEQVL